MLSDPRSAFNKQFTAAKYQQYLALLKADFPNDLDFRVAESPVFASQNFSKKMLDTCEYIIDQLKRPDFKQITDSAIPAHLRVPGEEGRPHFLIFDFGVCSDKKGQLIPQLIEMQGFATLFAYQLQQYKAAAKAYSLPTGFSPYFGDYNEDKVISLLDKLLKGGHSHPPQEKKPDIVKHTILLELLPDRQKTRIDFRYTEKLFDIPTVCLTALFKEGRSLFYIRDGQKVKINRIYNRLIFDEVLKQSTEIRSQFELLLEPLDVQWVTHPNWFYRLSKYTLPFLDHPLVPQTWFLDRLYALDQLPVDLENYVLKPLFSFAGNGVLIDIQRSDLDAIEQSKRKDYILQKKVPYAPAIQTPDGPAKAEIRVFYLWPEDQSSPVAVCNLARLTKGNMVGVAQNKDKTWVGGSFALFGNEH